MPNQTRRETDGPKARKSYASIRYSMLTDGASRQFAWFALCYSSNEAAWVHRRHRTGLCLVVSFRRYDILLDRQLLPHGIGIGGRKLS